jgi:antitoxin HicB
MKTQKVARELELSLVYAAKITQDSGGFVVTFRDLENVFTEGDTLEEALLNAQEVLDMLLMDMTLDEIEIPDPSKPKKGEILIAPSPEVAVPVLLYKLRGYKHYSMADVARTMGVQYQSYQQIESGKNITLKSLKKAAAALGATVEIKLHSPFEHLPQQS